MSFQTPSGSPGAPDEREVRSPEEPWVVVVNTHARAGERLLNSAVERLKSLQVPITEVLPVRRPERISELVGAVARGGARHVLVGGGDGTLSAAASVLVGTPVELGVLPLGTGNDFARNLGIPAELEGAMDVVAHGVTAEADVGRAGDVPFLNAASLGISAAVAQRMKPALKRLLGKLAYPLLALGELTEFRPFRLHLTTRDVKLEVDALQVVVGNGRYHGAGNVTGPEATLSDRRLDVYVIVPDGVEIPGGFSRAEPSQWKQMVVLARVARKLRSGGHVEDPNVLHMAVDALTLETEPRLEVNVDGELLGRTPMAFGVMPRGLRVRVPADSPLGRGRRVPPP